jgi:hypothetical protein
MTSNQRQYVILLMLVALVVVFGLWTASQAPELQVRIPSGGNDIQASDMQIRTASGLVVVGESDSQQVAALFPDGKALGMSTVYFDRSQGCTFTFTKMDKLKVMHIENPGLATWRGIKVGDTLDPAVIAAYGPNYGYAKKPDSHQAIDVAYGDNDGGVIFQVRDNVVTKIILQKEPPR